MPNRKSQGGDSASRPEATLVAADGSETTVHTTTAFNNLVYGQGYRPKNGTVEDAYRTLLEGAAEHTGHEVPMTPAE